MLQGSKCWDQPYEEALSILSTTSICAVCLFLCRRCPVDDLPVMYLLNEQDSLDDRQVNIRN